MEKGKTNNPNGRPTGKPNKVTADVKKLITEVIEESIEAIKGDLKTLEPYQRLVIIERFMRYVVAPEKAIQSIELLQEKEKKPYLIEFIGLDGEDNDFVKYDHSKGVGNT